MGGYTPIFSTVFEGSLYGKYPDTAAWLILLALADWRGHIEKTPEYISGVSGMPIDELRACIARFMEPDPNSRSQAHEGRKLVALDVDRPWGWRVVNIGAYRERAREMARVSDGRAAERQRRYRDRKRQQQELLPDVTTRYPQSPDSDVDVDIDGEVKGVPLDTSPPSDPSSQILLSQRGTSLREDSDATAHVNGSGKAKQKTKRPKRGTLSHFVPEDWAVTDGLLDWVKREELAGVDLYAETQKFRCHEFAAPRSDWNRAWQNWIRKAHETRR